VERRKKQHAGTWATGHAEYLEIRFKTKESAKLKSWWNADWVAGLASAYEFDAIWPTTSIAEL